MTLYCNNVWNTSIKSSPWFKDSGENVWQDQTRNPIKFPTCKHHHQMFKTSATLLIL